MKQWEYVFFGFDLQQRKVTDPDSGYRGKLLYELLPKLGADGWELVNILPQGEISTMFFKRRKS